MDRDRPSELTARVRAFVDIMAAPDPTLDELTLAVSQALQPDLDVIGAMAEIDAHAAACPTPTRAGVMQHLFGSGLFSGDRSSYHGWRNSCLDLVVESRRGMPITLAVVGVEVARRVGVELVGVGMPGHFLIGDPDDGEWFADPFNGRSGLGRRECREILTGLGATRWSDDFLAPTPNRLVVARILNNLKVSCERRGDRVRLAITMRLRQELTEFAAEADEARSAGAVLN